MKHSTMGVCQASQLSMPMQAADSEAGAQAGQRSVPGATATAEPVPSHVARALCPEGVSDHDAADVEGDVSGAP